MKYLGHFIFIIFVFFALGSVYDSILAVVSLLNGKHKKLPEDEKKRNLNALFQGPFMSILFLTFISMLNKANYSPFVFAYEDLRIICELVGINIDKFTLKN